MLDLLHRVVVVVCHDQVRRQVSQVPVVEVAERTN